MRTTTRFRNLLMADEILLMPGIHDALSARIAEISGFDAVTMGGFAATGALLAEPDSSQLGLTELADHYARICDAVSIPVFADADTGFGNPTNVRRAVRVLEKAGVAGLFIEDQVFPKRCGHTPGKDVIPVDGMVAKLKAALDARRDPDLVIMARTDALAVDGIDAAIERASIYRDVGVDLLFVEAPGTVADMRRIVTEVGGLHLANMIDFGQSPDLSGPELEEIGFATAVWPVSSIFAQAFAMRELMSALKRDGTTRAARDRMLRFDEFTDLVGLSSMRAREDEELDFANMMLSER